MSERAIEMMGETFVRIWTKKSNNTINFLADKIGISYEENIKQMQKVNLTEVLDKTEKVIKR